MRALFLEVDEALIAERRRRGLDTFDEMWEGVLHVVPQPTGWHQRLAAILIHQLFDAAQQLGGEVAAEIAVLAGDDDYRVADLAIYPRSSRGRLGLSGPVWVVVEIRSPRDESVAKIGWYLAHRVAQVVLIDQDTLAVEVHTADGPAVPDADGLLGLAGVAVRLGSPDPGVLVVETDEGTVRIEP